jgi:hypothetical protein
MGEVAVPSEADLDAAHALARSIVESVRNDEDGPIVIPNAVNHIRKHLKEPALTTVRLTWGDHYALLCHADRCDEVIFQLAQALTIATEQRDNAESITATSIAEWCESAPNDCGALHDAPQGWRAAVAGCIRRGEWKAGWRQSAPVDRLRTELVRLREAWRDDQGTLANHRFVTAVFALLDEVG